MEVYKIGVAIGLVNNMSSVLAVIGRDVLGLNVKVKDVERAFGKWAGAIGSVAGILGGTAVIGGLGKIAEHGSKLLDQQDKMQRGGVTMAQTLQMQARYFNNIASAIPTSTISEYLRTVNELRAVTGSVEGAEALAPKAMMVDTLLSNTFGHEMHGEYYKVLRSAEMKGIATDPARLAQFTDSIFSYITAFGGKLTADDFVTMARRGGTAFMNADISKAMGPLAVLGADLGGSATGTALMTTENFEHGANVLSKQQFGTLNDLGLVDASKAHKTGFGGGKLQLDPGAMKGSLEHPGDVPGWIHDVVWPAIIKAANGDKALEASLLAKIAPNRNVAKLIQMFGDDGFRNQITKDLGLAGQVESIPDAYAHLTSRNPLGVQKAFSDQFQSMLQAIGSPLMQAALQPMKNITEIFGAMGALANSHPEAIKYIGIAAGGIAAAAVAMGGIALASLIGIPTAVAGIGALALAVSGLMVIEWDKVRGYLLAFNDSITTFINWLGSIAEKVKGFFSGKNAPEQVYPGGTLRQKSSFFDPGQRQMKPQPISMSLNIDGKTLAQAVSDQLANLYGFPTGAPAADGLGHYFAGDHNYADI